MRRQLSYRHVYRDADGVGLAGLQGALAAEADRSTIGRLSGGLAHVPAPRVTRGAAIRRVSPDVRIAAAEIEKRAEKAATPESVAALGVAYVALGDWNSAVATLEEAVRLSPASATVHNDLAVAFLARASAGENAEDWSRGLAASKRAMRLDPTLVEPHFNRAIALQGLHLTIEARAAWKRYREIDRGSKWADESDVHLATLAARVRPGPADDRLPPEDLQTIRERIEDRLLTDWGHAIGRADYAAAARVLAEAESLARRLVEEKGDTMPADEIRLIRNAEQTANQRSLSRSRRRASSLWRGSRTIQTGRSTNRQ